MKIKSLDVEIFQDHNFSQASAKFLGSVEFALLPSESNCLLLIASCTSELMHRERQ